MRLTSFLAAGLLAGSAIFVPVSAQDAGRIDALENQIRLLTGQVEELTFAVKTLQKQIVAGNQQGAVDAPAAVPSLERKKLAAAVQAGEGIEVIEETQIGTAPKTSDTTVASTDSVNDGGAAPGPKVLGGLDNAAAKPEDGGFQGQVLVAPGGEEVAGQQAGEAAPGEVPQEADGGGIEQVALAAQSPQALFEQANEALLRRQFSVAADGFQQLLTAYPDHSLAGSAQYWLGETYYAQGDYRVAAQNFLSGYQKYPKSRRAPDSLLKLGMSLGRLGRKDQACASLAAVSAEYPKAVEAKKRAQAELKRAGC